MPRTARRLLLATGGVAIVAVAGLGGYWYVNRDHAAPVSAAEPPAGLTGAPAATSRTPVLPTNVPEPTAGQSVATDPPLSTAGGAVDVVVTYAGWESPPGVTAVDGKTGDVVVDGFVAGVIESGGTCTATLAKDGVTVVGKGTGRADATTTVCALKVADRRLTLGTWQVVLSYRSQTSTGTAKPQQVQVTPR